MACNKIYCKSQKFYNYVLSFLVDIAICQIFGRLDCLLSRKKIYKKKQILFLTIQISNPQPSKLRIPFLVHEIGGLFRYRKSNIDLLVQSSTLQILIRRKEFLYCNLGVGVYYSDNIYLLPIVLSLKNIHYLIQKGYFFLSQE